MSTEIKKSFLEEVKWVKEQIARINDWKKKGWAIGYSWSSGQPDGWTNEFGKRGLPIFAYVRGSSAITDVGSESAYDKNINILEQYLLKEKQEEIESIKNMIGTIEDYKARNWALGANWPDGEPDGFARYFALRNLKIASYLVGRVTIGNHAAYDENIATLEGYMKSIGD